MTSPIIDRAAARWLWSYFSNRAAVRMVAPLSSFVRIYSHYPEQIPCRVMSIVRAVGNQHRHVTRSNHVLSDAPQDGSRNTSSAVSSHDDQIDALLFAEQTDFL